jgi:hypothetical protein
MDHWHAKCRRSGRLPNAPQHSLRAADSAHGVPHGHDCQACSQARPEACRREARPGRRCRRSPPRSPLPLQHRSRSPPLPSRPPRRSRSPLRRSPPRLPSPLPATVQETAPATEGETTATAPAETEAKKELTPEELEAKKAARKAISGFLSQPHTAFEGNEVGFTVSVLTKDEAGNIVAPAAKRPGKAPYNRYMKYVDGALLSEILAQEGGPTRADVVWDEQHGYIQLIAVS